MKLFPGGYGCLKQARQVRGKQLSNSSHRQRPNWDKKHIEILSLTLKTTFCIKTVLVVKLKRSWVILEHGPER